MKRLIIAMVILLACALIIGCGTTATPTKPTTPAAPAPTSKPTATPTEQPQRGGVLKIILTSYPADFVTQTETTTPIQCTVSLPVWDPLLSLDKMGNWAPSLATNVDISADLKALTFTLRKGVKFHDGTDFNAAAVKYHIDNAKMRSSYTSIVSMDIIDTYTIRFNLSQYDATFVYNMATGSGQVNSMTAIQKPTTPENLRKDHIAGTGPFRYVDWKRDVGLRTVRNDGYWDTGKPYLDGIEFIYMSDSVSAQIAFEAGEAQVFRGVTPETATALRAKGYNVDYIEENGYLLVGDGGNADSPFADKRVRLAVEYALDRNALVNGFGYGFSKPLTQVCPPNIPSGVNPALQPRPYDPAKSKQLLADAGYPNGFDTLLIAQTSDDKNLLTAIQSYLRAVGIRATMDIADPARFSNLGTKGWNNGLMFWGTPANLSYATTMKTTFTSLTTRYHSQFIPPGIEQAITQACAEPDSSKRLQIVQNVVKTLYDEAVAVPVMTKPSIFVMAKSVHGCNFTTLCSTLVWTPADAWLSK